MLGYLYGKRFGSKIAWANLKEGVSVGEGPRSFIIRTDRQIYQV